MPVSKPRKNRKPRKPPPKPPTMDDFLAGHTRYEFKAIPPGLRCSHCNGPATELVIVWNRGRPWPAPSCTTNAEHLRRLDEHLHGRPTTNGDT